MAINAINSMRITNNLRSEFVVDVLRRNQLELFRDQERISTGRTYVRPSDDPVAASSVLNLSQQLGRQAQFQDNLKHADSVLTATDSTIGEINSLLIEASTIASQNLSNLVSAEERFAESQLVAGIRQQLVTVGNRQFDGKFIFAGRDTQTMPFVDALGGVAYLGDTGDLNVRVDAGISATVNVPGTNLFGALSRRIPSTVDLTPSLSADTRLTDLAGAGGRGVRLGTLLFNEPDGVGRFSVDLTGTDTLGDVVDAINTAAQTAGSNLTAELTTDGIRIVPGAPVSVIDAGGGTVSADLGVFAPTATSGPIEGRSLGNRITMLTAVEDLAGGAGIDLAGGLRVVNGTAEATIDLSQAETVQDIINAINNAGVFLRARISEDGSRIDIFNQVSGTSLFVGENGGTTATDLGIRTLSADTPLDDLNFGLGVVRTAEQSDLRIETRDGSTIEVDLDSAETIGDVMALINQAATDAGVSVTASLATTGNGIRLTDGTSGTGSLGVVGVNGSQAVADLGLAGAASADGSELIGADANAVRTEGILDALIQLEEALASDDSQGISIAAERIDRLKEDVIRTHGVVGARSASMSAKLDQMRSSSVSTQVFLSNVQDLDFAEAVTRMQAAEIQLQASLQTAGRLLNQSLMDFLR